MFAQMRAMAPTGAGGQAGAVSASNPFPNLSNLFQRHTYERPAGSPGGMPTIQNPGFSGEQNYFPNAANLLLRPPPPVPVAAPLPKAAPPPQRGGDGGPGNRGGNGDHGVGGDPGNSGGDPGCFVAGTLVLMHNGNSMAIEDVEIGDDVMAFDGLGPLQPAKVIAVFEHADKALLAIDGTLVTPEHPFLTPDGSFQNAGSLKVGDEIVLADGSSRAIEAINTVEPTADVYNIEVADLHTYVANGMRVHNWKHEGGLISEDRVPGQTAGDVPETLQEGEYVMRKEAVQMFGVDFFEHLNQAAMKGGMQPTGDAGGATSLNAPQQ